ncbi:hypothetical protein EVAR_98447_1 [Eumeta japonica]|uniref:Uncharacterized protein n=1 Tax=Eumeta variegata TaxID=151549 RepID=A0A4C1YSD9_EUMVA|nr:hypothetical protein EVAR_98447_1 [Eumeta japonica]
MSARRAVRPERPARGYRSNKPTVAARLRQLSARRRGAAGAPPDDCALSNQRPHRLRARRGRKPTPIAYGATSITYVERLKLVTSDRFDGKDGSRSPIAIPAILLATTIFVDRPPATRECRRRPQLQQLCRITNARKYRNLL